MVDEPTAKRSGRSVCPGPSIPPPAGHRRRTPQVRQARPAPTEYFAHSRPSLVDALGDDHVVRIPSPRAFAPATACPAPRPPTVASSCESGGLYRLIPIRPTARSAPGHIVAWFEVEARHRRRRSSASAVIASGLQGACPFDSPFSSSRRLESLSHQAAGGQQAPGGGRISLDRTSAYSNSFKSYLVKHGSRA